MAGDGPPILRGKIHAEPSAFKPENLLREARRQKGLKPASVPAVCLLDPDGDIARQLLADGRGRIDETWACYHTDLVVAAVDGLRFGVIGCAVGASYAVLIAEELFAAGCELLISITSSGQLADVQAPPYYVLIERALRDEGTSYHYMPPADYSTAPGDLIEALAGAFAELAVPVIGGGVWTTDAPFRETEAAIEEMSTRGLLAVEMEAAALYAFAEARGRPVVCFAHVTNQMARNEGDFEKGEADGTRDSLALLLTTARRLM